MQITAHAARAGGWGLAAGEPPKQHLIYTNCLTRVVERPWCFKRGLRLPNGGCLAAAIEARRAQRGEFLTPGAGFGAVGAWLPALYATC